MNWEHYFDTSSTVIMGYICTGKAFPKVELQMMKTTGSATPQTYYTMVMEGAFITKGTNSGTEEGNVAFSRRTSRAPVRFRYVRPFDRPFGLVDVPRSWLAACMVGWCFRLSSETVKKPGWRGQWLHLLSPSRDRLPKNPPTHTAKRR
jgi:hypothetical protein